MLVCLSVIVSVGAVSFFAPVWLLYPAMLLTALWLRYLLISLQDRVSMLTAQLDVLGPEMERQLPEDPRS